MIKVIKNKILKNYSTDIALRYLPVVDIIKRNGLEDAKILEVGSGDTGITTYFKKEVTGLDVGFGNKDNGLLKKEKYDGLNFPFASNEFDLVISVDSLEHIDGDRRQSMVNEMCRVSRGQIIIVVPCGREAEKQDRELADYFYKVYKSQDRFFTDHLKNGLPESDEVRAMLENAAAGTQGRMAIKIEQKLVNIVVRKFFMKCKISKNVFLSGLYYILLLLLPFRGFLNFGECYRCLFYISVKEKMNEANAL